MRGTRPCRSFARDAADSGQAAISGNSMIFAAGPLMFICLIALAILLRVGLFTDLDELLWSTAGEELDPNLNYTEGLEDEVALDFAGEERELKEPAEARLEQ